MLVLSPNAERVALVGRQVVQMQKSGEAIQLACVIAAFFAIFWGARAISDFLSAYVFTRSLSGDDLIVCFAFLWGFAFFGFWLVVFWLL